MYLVENPEDRFSRDEAHVYVDVLIMTRKYLRIAETQICFTFLAARLKAEAEEIEHSAKLESQDMVCYNFSYRFICLYGRSDIYYMVH